MMIKRKVRSKFEQSALELDSTHSKSVEKAPKLGQIEFLSWNIEKKEEFTWLIFTPPSQDSCYAR